MLEKDTFNRRASYDEAYRAVQDLIGRTQQTQRVPLPPASQKAKPARTGVSPAASPLYCFRSRRCWRACSADPPNSSKALCGPCLTGAAHHAGRPLPDTHCVAGSSLLSPILRGLDP
jgi:hypothetical protein